MSEAETIKSKIAHQSHFNFWKEFIFRIWVNVAKYIGQESRQWEMAEARLWVVSSWSFLLIPTEAADKQPCLHPVVYSTGHLDTWILELACTMSNGDCLKNHFDIFCSWTNFFLLLFLNTVTKGSLEKWVFLGFWFHRDMILSRQAGLAAKWQGYEADRSHFTR